jgi:hypothetical protein
MRQSRPYSAATRDLTRWANNGPHSLTNKITVARSVEQAQEKSFANGRRSNAQKSVGILSSVKRAHDANSGLKSFFELDAETVACPPYDNCGYVLAIDVAIDDGPHRQWSGIEEASAGHRDVRHANQSRSPALVKEDRFMALEALGLPTARLLYADETHDR